MKVGVHLHDVLLRLVLGISLLGLGLCFAGVAHIGLPEKVGAASSSPGADLIIQSITVVPAYPNPGQPANIEVRIANVGNADAVPVDDLIITFLYVDPLGEPDLNTRDTSFTGLFQLNAGASYLWIYRNYVFTTPGCSHTIWAWVDRDQRVIEDNENNNKLSVPVCVGTTPTPTFTPTQSATPTPTQTPTPTPTLTPGPCQPDSYEPDGSCTLARSITTDGVHQMHSLCPVGDEDWVKFTAQANITYTLATANVGSDGDTVLMLYNQCQQPPLAVSDPSFGNGVELLWEAPSTGEYYLKIKHHSATHGPDAGYELFIRPSTTCQGDSFEVDDSCATARDLTVGASAQRRQFCKPSDQDWAKFTTVSGAAYTISATSVGADAHPTVLLYNQCAFGAPLAQGQQVQWTAPTSAVYYVKIQNQNPNVFGTTTQYNLGVAMTLCGPDSFEPDESYSAAKPIVPGGSVQAHDFCPAGDQDWVKFQATQGQLYVIETYDLGADADTVMCLFGTDGTAQIACDDDSGGGVASRLRWTAPSAGTYYLRLRNTDDTVSGPTASYHLAISLGDPLDSFEADNAVATAKTITTDGTPQQHNFTPAGDQDWVKFDVVAAEPYVVQTLNLIGDCDTILHLIDKDGTTELASNDDYGGERSLITYIFPSAGIYYARVHHYRSNRSGRGTQYDLAVSRGSQPPTPSPTPTSLPTPGPTSTPSASGIRTLIVTNRERLEALYGTTATNDVMDHLSLLASDARVRGVILQAQADASAAIAYTLWNASPISTTLANSAAGAVRNMILSALNTNPGVEYIVLVGNDRVVPFRRSPDRTRYSEGNYQAFVSGNTTIWAACSDRMTLTDDFYADQEPNIVNAQEVYVPDYAIGRLPEGAEQIVAFIDNYLAQSQITMQRVLVTGYDFVVDAAQTVSSTIATDLGPGGVIEGSLMGDWWGASSLGNLQLNTSPSFGMQFIHGHANHHLQGAPLGGGVSDAQILSSQTAELNRALIVTLGCHSGLNDVGGLPAGLDLAQAFFARGANYIANTGYGWGSNAGLGWSERLVRNYVLALTQGSSVNIGKAVMAAKQRYYNESVGFDAYDEKALMESTLYGLPHYQLTSGGLLGVEDPFPSVQITTSLPLDSGPVRIGGVQFSLAGSLGALDEHRIADGTFFGINQNTHVVAGQPVQPGFYANVTHASAGRVHGVILTSSHYSDTATLDPVVAQPVNEWVPRPDWAEPALRSEGWWPGNPLSLQNLSSSRGFTDTLLTQLGQYNVRLQQERLYDSMNLDLYYSDSPDWTGPTITYVGERADPQGGLATVKVGATDLSGILGGVVTHMQGDGQWRSVDLAYDASRAKWIAEIPATSRTRYYVQVVDKAGNVAVANNKGRYYDVALPTPSLYLPLTIKSG